MGLRCLLLGFCIWTCTHYTQGWFMSRPRLPDACDGSPQEFTGNAGTITSPNFPSDYDDDLQCAWKIQVTAGKRITLHFRHFELEYEESCNYDFITIHDGDSASAPSKKLCGAGTPDDVTSTGSAIYLQFTSDGNDNEKGFQIDYSVIDNSEAEQPVSSDNDDDEDEDNEVDACNGIPMILTDASGIITSPGFPGNYGNNLNCAWKIQITTGRIRLLFIKLDVEYEDGCKYDRLTIYNGPTTSAPNKKLCGKGQPEEMISTGNALYLEFHSDDSNNMAGFQLQYSTMSSPDDTFSGVGSISTLDCDFERGFCGWTQSREETMDWLLGSGKTISDHTGPSSDHTNGDVMSRYIYIEASEREQGEKAQLLSPQLEQVSSSGRCMRFYYHMRGQDMGRLRVYKKTSSGHTELLWHRDGDQGNIWHLARINLPSGGGKFNLIIEAERGANFDSDIAIDDITIEEHACLVIPLDCGEKEVGPLARIMGGDTSSTGQWPWMVRIQIFIPGTNRYNQCGGSIINNWWILSASHCIEENDEFILDAKQLRVHFGDVDKANYEESEFAMTPELVVQHTGRTAGQRSHDIFLIKLPAPLAISEHVNKVCLPSAEDKLGVGTQCVVAGWGQLHHRVEESSKQLMHVNVEIQELSDCARWFGSEKVQNGMLCAGSNTKQGDACRGDSGGPLVCQMVNGQYVQAGIVSFGAPCGKYEKTLGVYTSVRYYTDWIESVIQAN